MSKEAKKYFIPVNGELVEVSEELYREYYRPIWNTRYHVRKNGECSCTKAQLWKCDGVCPGCPFYTAGKKVSLDTVIGGENDELTLGDTIADDSQTIESIIIEKELLEALYCQEGISFPALKQAGVKFAIIRAGFSTKKDVTMGKFVADCKKHSIDYGFYWYSYAMSVEQALTEAEKCIEVIKNLSPTYPVFFDMEEKKQISGLNTDTRTKMAIAFCEKIRQAGFKPGVYANPSFMENYYDKSRIVGRYDLWLAHWTNSPDCPSKYNYGQTMWQWGLDRIDEYDVDGDICFTDYSKKKPVEKNIDQLADEVLAGKWDNGAERERLLTAAGYDYNAVQKKVNEKLYRKTTDEIAVEVIAGLWGNGSERKKKLTEAGYDYSEVQRKVNQLIK